MSTVRAPLGRPTRLHPNGGSTAVEIFDFPETHVKPCQFCSRCPGFANTYLFFSFLQMRATDTNKSSHETDMLGGRNMHARDGHAYGEKGNCT